MEVTPFTRGFEVSAGAPLVAVSAMKTELVLRAPRAGVVSAIRVVVGSAVGPGEALVTLD